MSPTFLMERQEQPVKSSDKRDAPVRDAPVPVAAAAPVYVAAAFRGGRSGFAPIRSACCALSLALVCAALSWAPAAAQDRSGDELHKFNESVDALIRKVSPSVVQILVTGYGTQE